MAVPPTRRRRIAIQGLTPARKLSKAGSEVNEFIAPTAPLLIGHGYDIHRLQPGGKLILCGVEISQEISPVAHSDGDVAYHALVDAIFGALGLGDIGERFPNTDPRWKDAPSKVFVEAALASAAELNYGISNIDLTLMVERPKIKPFKPAMLQALRELVGAGVTVNVKAGTNEGCDAIGTGQAIASHAVVLLAARR